MFTIRRLEEEKRRASPAGICPVRRVSAFATGGESLGSLLAGATLRKNLLHM
ncbi:hypothetical protein E3U43_017201 [Larimichthys crocea]|uniref:Uncharacterized protein n=1 Tax=Larimichthys crocea TaxID=215358 RepID=A0ACD3QYP3_LARCR|nr:hypothetical protein E3U43_017201 [Larimichthys crocea]